MIRPRLLLLTLALLALPALGGCATVVPPPASLADPVPVYVADYGVHSSLLLPTPDGQFVEYAFGDWGYAAQNHNLPQDALGVLLVSFQSGLGRRYCEVPAGEVDPKPPERPSKMNKMYCEREDVNEIVHELDQRYQAGLKKQPPVKNPETGLEFVKVADHYSVINNCNHLTAKLLEQLGCQVKGLTFLSKFRVAKPDAKEAEEKEEVLVPGWNTARVD